MFGGLRLSYRERPVTALTTNRLQALFAYLALHAGLLQSRERLAFLFWPDSTEAQARTNLRQLLHHLRSALPDGGQFITADSQNILWHATPPYFRACPHRNFLSSSESCPSYWSNIPNCVFPRLSARVGKGITSSKRWRAPYWAVLDPCCCSSTTCNGATRKQWSGCITCCVWSARRSCSSRALLE